MKRERPEPLYRVGDVVRLLTDMPKPGYAGDLIVMDMVYTDARGFWLYYLSNDGNKDGKTVDVVEHAFAPATYYDAPREPIRP